MKSNNIIAVTNSASVIDYLMLMKPELTLLSVATAVGSSYLALHGTTAYQLLLHTFVGTTLVGGAAGILNQYIERGYDSQMKRTERRPIPAGHIQPAEALFFGIVLGFSGLAYLAALTNWAAVSLAVLTLISYLAVYTPMKRITPFATVVGGIPGALPPLIGWAIVRGSVSMEAWSLFFVLFFWQMPHFLSLGWIYRKDYAHAGYKLLTVLDPSGASTSRQILVYSLALIPASLMITLVGLTGMFYFIGALILTTGFLLSALWLHHVRTNSAARKLFYASLVLLPALFLLMMVG